MTTYAFRCKSCGHLERSDAAAECQHPHACCVCGAGVSYHPRTGAKSVDESNWEHLHECSPARLTELGLSSEQVATHTRWPESQPGHVPQVVSVMGATPNTVGAKDRGAGGKKPS